MRRRPRLMLTFALTLPALGLLACSKPAQEPTSTPPTATAPAETAPAETTASGVSAPAQMIAAGDAGAIIAAIASTSRLAGDTDEDAWRQPGVVLNYLEARPGMHVIDYFSAGGYYTELLSNIAGPTGQVVAYNNAAYQKYSADKIAKRYANDRLANVKQVTAAPEQLGLEPTSLDGALFVQAYHDLHWKAKDGSWPATDPAKALAQLAQALKPGAVVVVIDHVAAAGSDPAVSVDALHRIDPAVIKRDFEAAGLAYEGELDDFRNSADDHTKPVFDDSIRRKTDQVIYKFRKK